MWNSCYNQHEIQRQRIEVHLTGRGFFARGCLDEKPGLVWHLIFGIVQTTVAIAKDLVCFVHHITFDSVLMNEIYLTIDSIDVQ